ncbi:MAG: sodium/proline symporter [Waddliaceae bacterium]
MMEVTQNTIAFLIYFGILAIIGIISHRKQTTGAEFIVGGRSLNFYVTALSAHASDMSAWLFMGLPATIFAVGLSGSWVAIGLCAGMFCNWQFIAKRLREATEKYDSYTLSTFFERRFNDKSGIIRVLSAVMILIFLTNYLSAALIAMGLLLETIFGINYYFGITLATVVVVAYTFGGGYVTIAWTDLFQATFLFFVILLVPTFAYISISDPSNRFEMATAGNSHFFSLFPDNSWYGVYAGFSLALAWGLGYFGQPHIITKFLGIKDPSQLRKSKYLGMSWQILALTASVLVGVVAVAFFNGNVADPQLIFPQMVKSIFPTYLSGFILCGVIAANLSTMDSQILVCASVIGEDLYANFFNQPPKGQEVVRASRAGVVIVSFVSLMFAYTNSSTIMDTVMYSWAGLGSAFGPLVLISLWWKGATRSGAISGILVGGFLGLFWPWINRHYIPIEIHATVIGFALSLLSIYIVSKITKQEIKFNGAATII